MHHMTAQHSPNMAVWVSYPLPYQKKVPPPSQVVWRPGVLTDPCSVVGGVPESERIKRFGPALVESWAI